MTKVKVIKVDTKALEKEEKEIPKKPVMREGNRRDLFCASCGTRVSDIADRIIYRGKLQKFCGVCGGEIDWSEDK